MKLSLIAVLDGVRISPQSPSVLGKEERPEADWGYLVVGVQRHQPFLVWTRQDRRPEFSPFLDDWQSVLTNGIADQDFLEASSDDVVVGMHPMPSSTQRELIEPGPQDVVIPLPSVNAVSVDDSLRTLLVIDKRHGGPVVFHFREASPKQALAAISRALQDYFRESQHIADNDETQELDPLTTQIFSAFASVKQLYVGTATHVLDSALRWIGRPKAPSQDQQLYNRNPWIAERSADLPPSRYTGRHLNESLLASFRDPLTGAIYRAEAITKIVHFAGLDRAIRKRLWLHLLDVLPLHLTDTEAAHRTRILRERFYDLQTTAAALSEETLARIDKDVERTDRAVFHPGEHGSPIPELPQLHQLRQVLMAYCQLDRSLDYVQGMNDLCAPLCLVIGDDLPLAFWAFHNLMQSFTREHFVDASETIQRYLSDLRYAVEQIDPVLYDFFVRQRELFNFYFCYRWVLVLFKREFDFAQTLRVWDILLSATSASSAMIHPPPSASCHSTPGSASQSTTSSSAATPAKLPSSEEVIKDMIRAAKSRMRARQTYVKALSLALIESERDALLDHCQRFDDVLQHFNDAAITGHWDLHCLLPLADQYEQYLEHQNSA